MFSFCNQIKEWNFAVPTNNGLQHFYQNNMQMNFPLHSHILFESPWPFDMQIQMDKSFIAIIIILMCSAHFAHVSISFEWDFNMHSILPHCIRWRAKMDAKEAITSCSLGSFGTVLTKKRVNENKIRFCQKRIFESSKLAAFWSRRYTRDGQNKKKTIGFFEPGNEDFFLPLNFFYGSSLSLLGVLYL